MTFGDEDRSDPEDRAWISDAIRKVEADANRSADTNLVVFPLPEEWGLSLYLKDESTHPTGSLKHRLARSLFLYGLANGWIHSNTTIVEASSGSTAVSEAYFAQLLGLSFVAVMPRNTSREKCALIERYRGRCHFVDTAGEMYAEAARLASGPGAHYMDQFTYAERATDWRGNNNIAESIFDQLSLEPHPEPTWIVVGAGTGGTSATIGRYIRYRRLKSRLVVVDPENSAFFDGWVSHDPDSATGCQSRIEGIGRPRMEPSFVGSVIDRMIQVPDSASIAAMHFMADVTGLRVGPSTGTNLWGSFQLLAEMRRRNERGSVVTMICDSADRYNETYAQPQWLEDAGLDPSQHAPTLTRFMYDGTWVTADTDREESAAAIGHHGRRSTWTDEAS